LLHQALELLFLGTMTRAASPRLTQSNSSSREHTTKPRSVNVLPSLRETAVKENVWWTFWRCEESNTHWFYTPWRNTDRWLGQQKGSFTSQCKTHYENITLVHSYVRPSDCLSLTWC